MQQRVHFAFLNAGHFLDHLFMLVFATVAALTLTAEWGMSYGELIPYATPGFVAFGVCALPAGWLADKWSREGMMTVFFIGTGAAAMLTAVADTPLEVGAGLLAIGVFAAIYHPVGIPLVIEGRTRTGMPVAVNGVFGNLGVASAALLTGLMIDTAGWRAAFAWPGAISVAIGLAYWAFIARTRTERAGSRARAAEAEAAAGRTGGSARLDRGLVLRILAVIMVTTGLGGIVFQSTTFALPKILDERLGGFSVSATEVGWYAFVVFALAALAQLVVGWLIDNRALRPVFLAVAALQALFFALMPGLDGTAALVVAVAFMLAVFGQIPINDVLLGRIIRTEWRSRAYAVRYIVTFTGIAVAIPMIAAVHATWGFDALFRLLSVAAVAILAAVALLPRALPQ